MYPMYYCNISYKRLLCILCEMVSYPVRDCSVSYKRVQHISYDIIAVSIRYCSVSNAWYICFVIFSIGSCYFPHEIVSYSLRNCSVSWNPRILYSFFFRSNILNWRYFTWKLIPTFNYDNVQSLISNMTIVCARSQRLAL